MRPFLLAVIAIPAAPFLLAAQPDCVVTLAPSSVNLTSSSWNGVINVTGTPSGCRWTATSNNPEWLTVSFGTSGTGNGAVGYTATANGSITARTGTIRVNNATFTVNQAGSACSFSLTPGSTSVSSSGAIGTFAVNTLAGCSWVAVSTVEWVTITSAASGTGSGSVSYAVAANSSIANRVGTITVGSATFTISQGGVCNFTLTPTSINVPASGLSGTFSVIASSQSCDHSATSNVSWITISFGGSGTGNGTVGYTVAANNTPDARTGTISVGNQVFTVSQIGADCRFTVVPTFVTVASSGGSGKISVTTTCAWTAASNADWFSVISGASGTGNGTVAWAAVGNNAPQARYATLTIGSFPVSVTQAGVACAITITPTSASMTAAGGTGLIEVTAPGGCSWTATTAANWVTLSSGQSGSGEGTVAYTVAPNTSPVSRDAMINIGGQPFNLNQGAANCTFALSPVQATLPSDGGTFSISISTNCTWTAASNVGWISIASGSGSGSGDGTVAYTVAANPSAQTRTGSLTIGGRPFVVTQSGFSCGYGIAPSDGTVPGTGGTGSFRVTGAPGCAWTPSANVDWITIVSWSSVNGSGVVNYAAAFNGSREPRTGSIIVAGQVFTLTQGGAGPQVKAEGVVNAASFQSGPVAPGEIVTIFGLGLGPAAGASLEVTPDLRFVTSSTAGVRVLFDDAAAPVLYASSTQVSVVVPYAVAGKTSTDMRVEYQGVASDPARLAVAQAAPAIFTINATGSGQAAVLNQDFRVNSASNAAQRNSVVMIFATGEGETRPAGVDGKIASGTELPAPRLAVSVRIGGVAATVTYAGAAPGMVAGVLQVNARIPTNATIGAAIPVVVRVGNTDSQANVTVAIRQ